MNTKAETVGINSEQDFSRKVIVQSEILCRAQPFMVTRQRSACSEGLLSCEIPATVSRSVLPCYLPFRAFKSTNRTINRTFSLLVRTRLSSLAAVDRSGNVGKLVKRKKL